MEGVDFIVADIDYYSLHQSRTEQRVQLGKQVPSGFSCGSRPSWGRVAAEESLGEILSQIQGTDMLFIIAGNGGSTGTGAAPVIAQTARKQGILTVGLVSKPFRFEGAHRMRTAEAGIEELQHYVDTLIIIPNDVVLGHVCRERCTFADVFKAADEAHYSSVRVITDLINLCYADIRTVMSKMGKATMGTGEAENYKYKYTRPRYPLHDRAIKAAEAAIHGLRFRGIQLHRAKNVMINISGGVDMTLLEVDEAANRIRDEVDPEAYIIFGSPFDEKLNGKIRVSVVVSDTEHVVGKI
jgi:cell division protein FtsZ